MKIKYLGTGAAEGWPGLFCRCEFCKRAIELGGKNIRTRSQAVIDGELLVDFPPETYAHYIRGDVDIPNIHHLIITHSHQDHYYLYDLSMRGKWFANDVNDKLTVYGNDKVKRMFDERYSEGRDRQITDDRLACEEIAPYKPVTIGNHDITPLLATHDKSERCYIYLVERDGKSLLYGNDTGYFREETWEYLSGRNIDLISLDCTSLYMKEGTNHMGIEDVFEVQDRLIKCGGAKSSSTFVVNHFSHNGHLLHNEIEERVSKRGFLVTYDGMELEV